MATNWKFFLTTKEAWQAMYDGCSRAKSSIDFEQFIFDDELVHQKFFDLFKKKASQGVRVRLLCDMVGSFSLFRSSLVRDLREAGVSVQFFNQISPWRVKNLTSWFFRDHRKILVIDEKIGYTGGVGFRQEFSEWRDTHIRISGPVVEQMRDEFEKMWIDAKERRFIGSRRYPQFQEQFIFLPNAPHLRQRRFYQALLRAIRAANTSICLTTPYYLPSVRFLRALQKAARRGVRVRLLIPQSSDHKVLDLASQSFFGITLKAGVRIFQYQGPLIHAKTFIVDESWASVGSSNLDSQSFTFSYEANLITTNPDCVSELREHFENDIKQAKELHRTEWAKRPFSRRIFEQLTWPIHWVL